MANKQGHPANSSGDREVTCRMVPMPIKAKPAAALKLTVDRERISFEGD